MFTQRARYLLGFDGARSRIAEQIGLPFEGELARAGTAYIMFNADLSRYVAHRPSILHWIFNSKAGFGEIGMGLLRAIRPWNEWIAGWGFDIANGEPDLSDDVVLDRIRTLVGDPDLRGRDRAQVAVVRQPAARHQLPGRTGPLRRRRRAPAPAVERAGLEHLASRTRSTWPGRSRSSSRATPVPGCSTPTPPSGRRSASRSSPGPTSPARTTPACGSGSTATATTRSRDGLAKLKEASPEGVARRERLYEALELKNTEFNAHGVELNQRYESGAVLPDPDAGDEDVAAAPRGLPAGHHPPRGQAPARLARRRGPATASPPSTSPARAS